MLNSRQVKTEVQFPESNQTNLYGVDDFQHQICKKKKFRCIEITSIWVECVSVNVLSSRANNTKDFSEVGRKLFLNLISFPVNIFTSPF